MRRPLPFALLGLVVLAACGGGTATPSAAPGSPTVEMKEWTVVVTPATLTAGNVTLTVKNTGSSAHDLTIIKTDKEPDKLATDGSVVTEPKLFETQAINPGQTTTATVSLAAGNYVFICNVAGHYPLGMRTKVVVR